MRKFLILMRGDQSKFAALPMDEQMKIIQAHQQFSQSLEELGQLIDGDGLCDRTLLCKMEEGNIKSYENPFAETPNQLSGYYIIKCDDFEKAIEIGKRCPALLHGETVEIVPIGH